MPDEIDPASLTGRLVRVHYNLHRCPGGPRAGGRPGEACFVASLKVGGSWKVAGYVQRLLLEDAEFKVSLAGVRSIREKGQRAVIAWIIGTAIDPDAPSSRRRTGNFNDWVGVGFNPFKADTFYLDDGSPVEEAPLVYMSGRKAAIRAGTRNPMGGPRSYVEGWDDLDTMVGLAGGALCWG